MLLFSLRARCSGLPPNGCAPIVRQQRFLIAIVNPVSHGLLIKHSPPGAFMMLILCFLMYFFVFVFIHSLFQFIHSAVAVHVQFFVLFFFFFVSLPRRRQHIFHFLLLLLPSHFCRFCFLLYIYFFHILYIPSQMFMNEKKIDFLFVWKAEQEKYTFLMKIFFFFRIIAGNDWIAAVFSPFCNIGMNMIHTTRSQGNFNTAHHNSLDESAVFTIHPIQTFQVLHAHFFCI